MAHPCRSDSERAPDSSENLADSQNESTSRNEVHPSHERVVMLMSGRQ